VLALHESGDLALVGGRDATAGVFSLSQNRLLQPLKGGQGSITSGVWAQDKAVIATSKGVVKVFEAEKEVSSFSAHGGPVNAVALHASSTILASVGDDKTYALYDLESNQLLTQVQTDSGMPITSKRLGLC
jgi:pre-mRNA-processing factor 19